jgi:hypothetical protein
MQSAKYFQYPWVSNFKVTLGSDSQRLISEKKLGRLTVPDMITQCYPEEVAVLAPLFSPVVGYDISCKRKVDWSPVVSFIEKWKQMYDVIKGKPAITYYDGGDFLTIEIHGENGLAYVNLKGLARRLYLFCVFKSMSRVEIGKEFSAHSEQSIDRVLGDLVHSGTMFVENDRYLSLAISAKCI